VTAGFDPDGFWKQTPKSFVAVMEGAARRQKREFDLAITQAWHAVAFDRTKRLKGLADYLVVKPKYKAQTPEAMFAALMQMQAGGAPLSIREIN
jgi:hypothetical protein